MLWHVSGAGAVILLQLHTSASVVHPGGAGSPGPLAEVLAPLLAPAVADRQAFYGLYEPMMRAPGEWPQRYHRFNNGGVVVMDPYNVSRATVAEVKAKLNATVLM